MPGISELLNKISKHGLFQGILTRNLRAPTNLTLERLGLTGFSQIITREDGPPKPDPAGLHQICKAWNCAPNEVIFIGDYHFDLLAGARAGMKTILYTVNERPSYAADADYVVEDFSFFAAEFEKVMTGNLKFFMPTKEARS